MPLERIQSYLVLPSKNQDDQPEVSGIEISPTDGVYPMLFRVYERAPIECDIDIVFRPDANGQQNNESRDLLVEFVRDPSVDKGRLVASHLQSVTTHRSGSGLLFIMKGSVGPDHHLVISRFPADQGVIAQGTAQGLSVEFLDQVFMKSAKAYKSAIYVSDSLQGGFWEGQAIDRQITGSREISDYWIIDFLASALRTTGPAGTKRLAVALRKATRSVEELGIRQELIAFATLLHGQDGNLRSVNQLAATFGISDDARTALETGFPRPDLMNEIFQFDSEEFQRHAPYRSVELDNGALLIAEEVNFGEVFRQQELDGGQRRVRYVTEGRVVDERLRKLK